MWREPKSKIFRRCCPRRNRDVSKGTKLQLTFPETPLIVAGALGGPFCIYLLTPLRNALTLASQEPESSVLELYASAFAGGFSYGWVGGTVVVVPSCPQFCVMGPLFHCLKDGIGSVPIAVVLCAICETFISYGSQTVNAQLIFNENALFNGELPIPLLNPFNPFGPGMVVHIIRNAVALSGIRIFAGPCRALIRRCSDDSGISMPGGAHDFLADFLASLVAAILSAPLSQCYNFAVTSSTYQASGNIDRIGQMLGFVSRTYIVYGPSGGIVGLSRTLARDLFMRCVYIASLYAMFATIERTLVAWWKRRRPKNL